MDNNRYGYMCKTDRKRPESYISIVKKSITAVTADCVVNAANRWLQQGGGVCGYIFQAAGARQLQQVCNAIGGCPTGKAVITPGFNLCKYIIHAVGPEYKGGNKGEAKQLYSCYKKSMDLAKEYDIHTIVFPLISAGIYCYPVDKAWRKALQAVNDWIKANEGYKIVVKFAVIDDDIMDAGIDMAEELSIQLF